jgi:hypothetical protein
MHVTVEGRVWFVPPTRAVWIPADVEHQIGMKGEVSLRTLYLDGDRALRVTRGVEALRVSSFLSELILHILSERMLDPRVPEHDHLARVLVDQIVAAPGIDLALPMPRDERAIHLGKLCAGDYARFS